MREIWGVTKLKIYLRKMYWPEIPMLWCFFSMVSDLYSISRAVVHLLDLLNYFCNELEALLVVAVGECVMCKSVVPLVS